ncbi:MAG TPA: hypothetical protein VGE21_16390, partial [Flavobacteriales bacterium]
VDVGNGPADCWRVPVWDVGTTEPGSSGSGLWNANHQLIGQLYGGQASCDNNVNDYYGRLSESWEFLAEWLGACGDTLGGFDPNAIPIEIRDASITSIVGIAENVCNDTVIEPTVTLKNNGEELLTVVTIEYLLNDVLVGDTQWTGNLQPVQTVNVQLPPIPVSTGQHELKVRSTAPNNLFDFVPANDADSVQVIVNSPGMPVHLSITPDDFGSDITWTLENEEGTVLYSGGPYQDMDTDPLEYEFCLGSGCFVFTINDAFGDGICCGEGEGGYSIISEAAEHVVSDGQYGSGEVREFCLAGVGMSGADAPQALRLWPNPSTGELNLAWSAPLATGTTWMLRDAMGRLCATGRIGSGTTAQALDLRGTAAGVYVMEMAVNGVRYTARVALQR